MRKTVEGSYPTLQDALMAVERLRETGYGKDEIFLVANEDIRQDIRKRSEVQVEEPAALEEGTDTEARSLWDRVREAFTVDNYDPDVYIREERVDDEDPLHGYQEEVAKGNILVLLHRREREAGAPREASSVHKVDSDSGTSVGKRSSDYVGVDSQTPRTINSTGKVPLSDENNTLADPEKSLDVDVEGMKQEYEQQREWGEKSLREGQEGHP